MSAESAEADIGVSHRGAATLQQATFNLHYQCIARPIMLNGFSGIPAAIFRAVKFVPGEASIFH